MFRLSKVYVLYWIRILRLNWPILVLLDIVLYISLDMTALQTSALCRHKLKFHVSKKSQITTFIKLSRAQITHFAPQLLNIKLALLNRSRDTDQGITCCVFHVSCHLGPKGPNCMSVLIRFVLVHKKDKTWVGDRQRKKCQSVRCIIARGRPRAIMLPHQI